MEIFRSAAFLAHVHDLIEQYHVPGLAIAFVHEGNVFSAGYGKASLNPPTPCTADTLFDIASCSKSLTAASVALLVQDNEKYPEVQWETPMSLLLPNDFVMSKDAYTESVTVEDILSHRSGLPGHDDSYMSTRAEQPDDSRSVTRNLRNLPVVAPIRTKYMYCNMMYTVATYLVEVKSGLSFSDFLEQHFFKKLKMDSSNLRPSRARAKGLGDRISDGHFWDKRAGKYKNFPFPDMPEAQGAGSVITSANDYIKYIQAMLTREDPFTREVYEGITRSRTIVDPEVKELSQLQSPLLYAAGWESFIYRGHMVVQHDGGDVGSASRHFFVPAFNFGGVIFGNADGATEVSTILAMECIDEVLSAPKSKEDRLDWKDIVSKSVPEYSRAHQVQKLLQEVCPGIDEPQSLKMPLSAYTGQYWNPGYHGLLVGIKDEKLFTDATDRCMGYELTFEHVCEQTQFMAHKIDFFHGPTDEDNVIRTEFRFDEKNRAIRLGLDLEDDMDDLIWFDRVADTTTPAIESSHSRIPDSRNTQQVVIR